MQSLLRHANPGITLGIYTHAVNIKKREAQSRVVEMVLPAGRKRQTVVAEEGIAYVYLLVYHAFSATPVRLLKRNGGDDGTRTRGLCRDRAATTSKSLKSNGVGRHSLVRQDILSHCYRPLNVPRSEALVRCPRLASRFKCVSCHQSARL